MTLDFLTPTAYKTTADTLSQKTGGKSAYQICVDKARLQRYNERIRNDKPLYYK